MSNDIKGLGNSYTAENWEYGVRLGKRWNVDPVVDPSMSSYVTMANNPISNNDPDGDCTTCPKDAKTGARHFEVSTEASGSTPTGGLVYFGNVNNSKVHVQYTNIGNEKEANWVVNYFYIEGQNGGWSWNNDNKWFTRNEEEYKQNVFMNIADWGFREVGKPMSEATKNILEGEPLKDTKAAYAQYKEQGGSGGIPGFIGSGVASSVSNWWGDLNAGGHRRGSAIIGLWQISADIAGPAGIGNEGKFTIQNLTFSQYRQQGAGQKH